MKIHVSNRRGSTLLVAVIITGIVSATLGSYLMLLQSQNRVVMESLSWNAALPVAEAGIEEAMTHLTRNGASNLAVNGWSSNSGSYLKSRDLADGKYDVSLSRGKSAFYWDTNYTILSTGSWRRPQSTNYASRTIQVGVNQRMKYLGIVTKQGITLGGSFTADSFDSGDTNASTGGLYDPAKRKAGAFVGSNAKSNNVYSLSGHAIISGYVATGPGGSIKASGASSVGDLAWTAGPKPGIQTGHFRDDTNVQIPDVLLPSYVWAPVTSASIGGTNYTGVLTGGAFTTSTLGSGSTLLVTKPSVLYVPGNVTLDHLLIVPGGSLEMYVAGNTVTFNQLDLNPGGNALNFMYYGLPSNTQINFSSDAKMVGCIYAPQADANFSGSGMLFGGLCCKSVKITGGFQYHFDENLAKNGPSYGLYITSWDEP